MNDLTKTRAPARVVIILLLAWGLLTIRLGAPWFGHQEDTVAWRASVVRNYRLYGAAELGFMTVTNPGPATPETYTYYTHHPPLAVWLMAAGSVPFGFNEAAARFGMISITMMSLSAFYVLARRLYGRDVAWWSAVFYTLTPMFAYFGRWPTQTQLSWAIMVIFAAVLVNWLRRPTPARWWALAALAWLGIWAAWAPAFYVGMLGIVVFWLGQARHRRAVVVLGGVTLLAIVAVLGFYELQLPGAFTDLLDAFVWRSSNTSFRRGSETFTLVQFVTRNFLDHLAVYVSPGIFILGLVGIVPALRRGSRHARGILTGLFAAGLSYILVFRNAAYIHDFYKAFLVPPLAITAAVAFLWGWRWRGRYRFRRYVRPVLAGLLVGSVLTAGVFLTQLHSAQLNADVVLDVLAAHTEPDDLIITNLDYASRAVEFYAFRNVEWAVQPADALAQVEAAGGAGVYIYCSPDADPPETLDVLPYATDESCLIYRWR